MTAHIKALQLILLPAALLMPLLTGCQSAPASALEGHYTLQAQSVQVNGTIINIGDWPGSSVTVSAVDDEAVTVCIDSLLPGFDTDDEATVTKKLQEAPLKIAEIAGMIARRERGDHTFHGSFSHLKSRIIYPAFMRMITDKPFHTDPEKCTGCGRCATVCPTHNIVIADGRPQWQGNCINCLACYHHCPTKSIGYGKKTRQKGQYHFK